MRRASATTPATSDAAITIGVRVTSEQYRDIRNRTGIGPPVSGAAISEYLLGCALDEPREALLARVREIDAGVWARLRAEIDAERAAGE